MSSPSRYEKPLPVPAPEPVSLGPGLTRLNPLTRRGVGPALFVLVDKLSSGCEVRNGVPTPLMKWAEEGYCCVEVTREAFETDDGAPFEAALIQLNRVDACQWTEAVGMVCYEYNLWEKARRLLKTTPQIVGAVIYGDAFAAAAVSHSPIPALVHLSGTTKKVNAKTDQLTLYEYPEQISPRFANPATKHFDPAAEALSHTRNLTFLKKIMGGPIFDLEEIWEEHCYYEFVKKSVEDTMNTMVQEPYVNHIPTLAGGIGREQLTEFYTKDFISCNPKDTKIELISRTVGIDRVVDEFIFKFTHDRQMNWIFPAVPITGFKVEIPMTAIVNIRGDRLNHEHISWDSASALRQIGCLPEYVPFFPQMSNTLIPDGAELRLPVAGSDIASKVRSKDSVKSNQMFEWGIRENRPDQWRRMSSRGDMSMHW